MEQREPQHTEMARQSAPATRRNGLLMSGGGGSALYAAGLELPAYCQTTPSVWFVPHAHFSTTHRALRQAKASTDGRGSILELQAGDNGHTGPVDAAYNGRVTPSGYLCRLR